MSPDDEHETPTAVIEMQNLVERPEKEDNDPERERALREWKQIGNVDTFLEQVTLFLFSLLLLGVCLLSGERLLWDPTRTAV
jgi:hypothetical protein